jgi:peroxiredoxin (alkyl hydroperoxide reductase subunit C)
LISAFKHVQANPNEVCPMNWTPGDKTMNPDPEKSQEYFKDLK